MLRFIFRRLFQEELLIYFNTSHVTVYREKKQRFLDGYLFQYISCYGLSVERLQEMKPVDDFNTSHVTVYQPDSFRSHSSTSRFQYISCYGLSCSYCICILLYPNFNTSHVTVYRWDSGLATLVIFNFNTSHVTVYHHVCA